MFEGLWVVLTILTMIKTPYELTFDDDVQKMDRSVFKQMRVTLNANLFIEHSR